uniref:Ribonuclease H-like domain-containing protein n=1 Tax=Tanacetum cinerariifolium TaxID=118510 RepID=A0A6L2MA83_TANCI|nr:ribonuclease H-like domain-containing protein [Tanacetum cinerariifolium]
MDSAVFANIRRVGKGFSGVETPLFEGMLAAKQLAEEGIAGNKFKLMLLLLLLFRRISPQAPPQDAEFPTHIQQILDVCSALTRRVKNLENDKAAQNLEIIKLKAKVKRFEKVNKVKSLKLKRLRKVGASKRIESSDDMEDVFNQGRMIDDLDKDEGIELIKDADIAETKGRHAAEQAEKQAEIYHLDLDHSFKVLSKQEDDSEVQEVVEVVTTTKLIKDVVTAAPQVSAASATISAAKPSIPAAAPTVVAAYTRRRKGDKGKGILIETSKPMKKKDQIELDAEYVRKLHEEINKDHEEINKDIDWDAAINHLSIAKSTQDLSHTNRPSAPIIEEWVSDSEDESETTAPQIAPSFVQSVDHLIKDCTFYAKPKAQPTPRNYAHRGYNKQHASFTKNHSQKHIVPAAVLTKSKPVSVTAVRPVSAAVPKIMVTRPRHAHSLNTKSKSTFRRHLTRSQSPKISNSPPKVTTVKAPVVSAAQGMKGKWVRLGLVVVVYRRDDDETLIQPSCGYHAVPSPITRNFMPPKPDLVFYTAPIVVETDHSACTIHLSTAKPTQDLPHINRPSVPIIEEWVSDSEDEYETRAPQIAPSFVQQDCTFYAKPKAQPTPRNYAHRGYNKQHALFTKNHPQKHIVPATVLTKSKPVSVTAVRPVSAAVPKIMISNSPLKVTAVKALVVSAAQGKGSGSESSAKKKGRTVSITTEDIQKRRNDVKARTTLLLALPNEHQLRFIKYETAQELWGAILKTFGGNEATKKTKKNQLKQQYGNFKAEGSETLEKPSTDYRLFLAPEWLMYTIVWRNKDDLDKMSLDDVYNHLKVYEPEVQKKSEINSQNMAFISSSNTSSRKGEVHTASVPTASTQVCTASTDIDEDDIKEMDIKWNMALLSMRADRFWKKTGKKITIQGSDVAGFDKSKAPKALMDIDGIGWDWSYMANEEENNALVANEEVPTEFALMTKSSSSSKNEVYDDSFCSKSCRKNTENLNTKITKLSEELSDRLPEFADDTVTDYSRPTPSIDSSKSNTSDLQNSNSFVSEHGESSDSIMSKPMIKFVKASDSPGVIKTNKTKTARKPPVKYAKMAIPRITLMIKDLGTVVALGMRRKDGPGKDVELHLYRSMIESLMYLTASRPDIMFAVFAYARHQVIPKECHFHAVKRIFRYLKGHPKLRLWYPKESPFDLVAYSDSDYGGATQDRKSTT